jgi:hypothetical protein
LREAIMPLVNLGAVDRQDVPRWLRPTALRVQRSARVAARRFDDAMNDIDAAADFTSDPGVVAGMRELARLVQALRWMRDVETWEAAVIQFAPHRRDQFRGRLRQWFDDLLDAGRAQRAMDLLRRLDHEVDRFAVLAFEDELREPTPAAIQLTGGMNEELSGAIRRLRREWAEAWSAGEPDDATSRRLDLARRLLTFLEGSETLLALRDESRAPLERWSAWAMPPQHMRRLVGDVPSRLKLACGAAARGRQNMLERQLDQMERQAPVAWLIAQCSIRMEDELADLPDGAPGLVGQLMLGPSDDAWLVEERVSIAHVCRYALEAEFANRIDRGGLAGELNRYVSGLARDLLRAIDESP